MPCSLFTEGKWFRSLLKWSSWWSKEQATKRINTNQRTAKRFSSQPGNPSVALITRTLKRYQIMLKGHYLQSCSNKLGFSENNVYMIISITCQLSFCHCRCSVCVIRWWIDHREVVVELCHQCLCERGHDSEYVWSVGRVPGQHLLTMWTQPDQLGSAHGGDVHLLLPAALHPRAAAQHHCALGPLQTH